jgi:hypothetical protein
MLKYVCSALCNLGERFSRPIGAGFCILALSFGSNVDVRTVEKPLPARAFISVSDSDFSKSYRWAKVRDFAFSPDDKKMAVEVVAANADSAITMSVVEWDFASNRSTSQVQLPNAVPADSGFAAAFHRTIEYTPDGSAVFVESEGHVYRLNLTRDGLQQPITYPLPADSSASERVGRLFSVAADGDRVAVLAGQSSDSPDPGVVHIFRASSGEELAQWRLLTRVRSFALSATGKEVLVSVADPTNSNDIMLVDALSGEVVRRFQSGLPTGPGVAVTAMFMDHQHFVVVPDGSSDRKGRYLADVLKVFDSASGTITRELTFDKWGPAGEAWVSRSGSMIAALDLWMSPGHRRFNFGETGPSQAKIAFFRLDQPTRVCILGPLPESHERPRQSGFLRFSTDLELAGLFGSGRVAVYSTSACTDEN